MPDRLDDPGSPLLSRRDGRLLTLQLNRPAQLNALDGAMSAMLCDAFDALDPAEVDAVVLTGDERAFCAGMDLRSADMDALAESLKSGDLERNPMYAVDDCPVPVIAAIDGHCVGAGLALALASDIRVASVGATFAFPEVRRGFPPAGGIHRLQRTIGPGRARLMMYSGRTVDAATMLAWGGVDLLADGGSAVAVARDIAGEIGAAAGAAIRAVKELTRETAQLDGRDAATLEYRRAAQLAAAPETRERLAAFHARGTR